jgi:tetratricopeptide (TPR) repeat protein
VFEDRTEAAGVARQHHNRSFENPYAHIMEGYTALGAAVAVADYDRDGFDDLFVTDSAAGSSNLLYHNDGEFTFTEVGAEAGVAAGNDAHNATADALWLDYDGDGWEDLVVVRFGRSLLFRNLGDGTFREHTAAAGLDRYLNAITALAVDYDRDGDLDLLLGNYFQAVDLFDPKTPRFFPESFETAANGGGLTLYRNEGDGTFSDQTAAAGLAHHSGWTLDLGHADYDRDGDQDLYVAADFGTDRFLVNNGDGTFTDTTEHAIGIDTKKGMNVDWGDFDNDGLFDIYVTNITDEYMREGNFLWRNNGDGTFADVARETGTHDTGWGWAGKFFDYDNDGWLDLYVVNGWVSAGPENYVVDVFELIVASATKDVASATKDVASAAKDDAIDLADARNWPPMGNKTLSGYQRNRLFHSEGGALFHDRAKELGLDSIRDARGVAVADFDNDGRLDLFVTNANAQPNLYRNVHRASGHWLELLLAGSGSNWAAIGATVRATSGGVVRVRLVDGGNGFAGQSMRRVHFGLGDASATDVTDATDATEEVEELEVLWPSGRRQLFEGVSADAVYLAVEGVAALQPFNPGMSRMVAIAPDVVAAPRRTPRASITADRELLATGLAAAERGDLATALDRLERAVLAAPEDLRTSAEYRQVAIAAKACDRAIELFTKLADQYPTSATIRLNLGYAYVDKIPEAGAVTQVILASTALGHFTATIELEPSWLAIYTRGNSYVYWPAIFRRTELGMTDLRRAIALAESMAYQSYHARAWVALGDGWWRFEDLDQARRVWREGLARYPGTSDLVERLALSDEELEVFLDSLYALGNRVETDLRELWE